MTGAQSGAASTRFVDVVARLRHGVDQSYADLPRQLVGGGFLVADGGYRRFYLYLGPFPYLCLSFFCRPQIDSHASAASLVAPKILPPLVNLVLEPPPPTFCLQRRCAAHPPFDVYLSSGGLGRQVYTSLPSLPSLLLNDPCQGLLL